MTELFQGAFRNRRVLVTGHTGFKGSWLCLWLERLGARVVGFSLGPPTQPSHFELLGLNMESLNGDIRDLDHFGSVIEVTRPEIIFHLAAQSLVSESFFDPTGTFATNVQGTANLLECCRSCPSVQAVVVVSSDKCYHIYDQANAFRETDKLGGLDPYSASKAGTELVVMSYRDSFFKHNGVLVASCRAGNVLGGGDWASNRLLPDLMVAAFHRRVVTIRRPEAIRPWQHVLDVLAGYLLLAMRLVQGDRSCASAWNFGPREFAGVTVKEITSMVKAEWEAVDFTCDGIQTFPETAVLRLNSNRAMNLLDWEPIWSSIEKTIYETVGWYRQYYETEAVISGTQLDRYVEEAKRKDCAWTDVARE